MIKSPIFEVKVIGPMMYKFGQLPVFRGRGDAGLVLKKAEEALRAGACVIVYPEGTASRDPDLWPMVGKTGAARLALTTGAPVVPVAQWGAQEILPYGTKKPKLWPRKTVRMVAGPAGRPVRVPGPAARCVDASGRDRRHHGRHHRLAGQDQAGDAPRRTMGSRRGRPGSLGPNEGPSRSAAGREPGYRNPGGRA